MQSPPNNNYPQYPFPTSFQDHHHAHPHPHPHEHEHNHNHNHNHQEEHVGYDLRPVYSHVVMKRALGVKVLGVLEILFSIWLLVLSDSWLFILYIPIAIIGFFGAHRLNKNLINVYAFSKAFMLGLFLLVVADYISQYSSCGSLCYRRNGPLETVLVVLILIFQIICIYLAVKLRQDITQAAGQSPFTGVEMDSGANQRQAPAQPAQQPHQPRPQSFHEAHMAAAPVAMQGYPNPNYFPMPYMNQAPQGYPMPVGMPYGSPYPQPHAQSPVPVSVAPAPVPTYPAFTIVDEEQNQQ